jgi:trehalose 6-phosphate synthase
MLLVSGVHDHHTRTLPAALDGMLSFDVVGYRTDRDVRNFLDVVGALSCASVSDDVVESSGSRTRVRAFPIGIIPEAFALLLQALPEWREKVSLLQISVPTRGDVLEYQEQRRRVEVAVGHIERRLRRGGSRRVPPLRT